MKLKDKIQKVQPAQKIYAGFGEIMLRLSSPGFERLLQSSQLEATFGGGESNVMASLAIQGKSSRFITALPDNQIGESAIKSINSHGVDTSNIIITKNGRMGLYFLEKGANQRPSKVIYDRAESAVSLIGKDVIDWEKALDGCGWFHITGITPALSKAVADEGLRALTIAKEKGLVTSCDLNYRAKLWQYGKKAVDVMPEYVKLTDIVIANEEDCQKTLGIGGSFKETGGAMDKESYKSISSEMMDKYDNVSAVAITLRESFSASCNRWSACYADNSDIVFSREYEITDIVDRVGGGDSFSAGLIYGLSHFDDKEEALEYAVAASSLCHSIEGDVNLSTVDEIKSLMDGDAVGRIKR